MRLASAFAALAAFATAASALTIPITRHQTGNSVSKRDGTKMVFAHFMVGIVASYTQADWEADIKQAMGIGIDGFALNCGTDSYTPTQLGYAYAAASAIGGGNFHVFISFDFSSFDPTNVDPVVQLIQQFGNEDAQLKINDKVFVSSFAGDGFAFRTAEANSGMSLFACPAWGPDALTTDNADCGMQWNAWPSANNAPIDANMTTDNDNYWIQQLNGKPYMAGASPWFFTHYGADTYNKNYLYLADTLWVTRWEELLQLQPDFVEIITWNDFGESHYIGPLHDDNVSVYAGGENGAQKWAPGHDHSAWATVAAPYIAAYKAGSTTVSFDADHLVYHYRQQSKSLTCSDSVGAPTGYDYPEDAIFVTAMLTSPGTVVITSGSNAPVSIDVQAGINTVSAPMGIGQQSFQLVRNGNAVLSGVGYQQVRDSCDVYDFNAFVGEITGNSTVAAATTSVPVTTESSSTTTSVPVTTESSSTTTSVPVTTESSSAPVTTAVTESSSTTTEVSSSTTESSSAASSAALTPVTFSTQHTTAWGDELYVYGSVDALGNWDQTKAVPLTTDSTTYPTWSGSAQIPSGTEYEYKYFIIYANGTSSLEADPKHESSDKQSVDTYNS